MLGKIGLVVAWLPRIVAVVILAEELLDDSVSGAEKKSAALEFLSRQGMLERHVAVIGSTIDLVVDVLHAVGVFKRSKAEADVAIEPALLSADVRAKVEEDAIEDAYKSLLSR